MTRAVLARKTGTHPETLRFYEQKRLIPAPHRSPAGYRIYEEEHARQVRFIKRTQELGFTLKEIREILMLRKSRNKSSRAVKDLAEAKITQIAARIQDLQRIRKALMAISGECHGTARIEDCPILNALVEKP